MPPPAGKSPYDGQLQRQQNIVNFPPPVMFGVLVFYSGKLCHLLKDPTGNGITFM